MNGHGCAPIKLYFLKQAVKSLIHSLLNPALDFFFQFFRKRKKKKAFICGIWLTACFQCLWTWELGGNADSDNGSGDGSLPGTRRTGGTEATYRKGVWYTRNWKKSPMAGPLRAQEGGEGVELDEQGYASQSTLKARGSILGCGGCSFIG